MALGMRHWFGLTAVGLALVAVRYVPPEAMQAREVDLPLAEVARADALNGEINRSIDVLKRIRWSDSLSAIVAAPSAGAFSVGYPTGITRKERKEYEEATGHSPPSLTVDISDEVRDDFEERIRTGFDQLDRTAEVRFGYFLVDSRSGSLEWGRKRNPMGTETYVGELNGQAYCMTVNVGIWFDDSDLWRAGDFYGIDGTRTQGNVFSYCLPFLRHGLPGDHIMKWLQDGALSFAAVGEAGLDREGPSFIQARRTYFGLSGMSYLGWRDQELQIDQCLAGMRDGCLAAFTSPELLRPADGASFLAENSPVIGTGASNWRSPFGPWDDYVMTDLEAEFGGDAFHRFWTSEKPVTEAFEDAFGMDMGDWGVHWVDTYMGISRPGPRLTKTAALGGMLAVSFFAALAGAWARRRRVA